MSQPFTRPKSQIQFAYYLVYVFYLLPGKTEDAKYKNWQKVHGIRLQKFQSSSSSHAIDGFSPWKEGPDWQKTWGKV